MRRDQDPSVRRPAVAGMFYPADPAQCRRVARRLVEGEPSGDAAEGVSAADRPLLGAVVPHAGWVASGAIAGQAIRALAESLAGAPPQVVVVFGAVHTPIDLPVAALDSHARWEIPSGDLEVSGDLSARLLESDLF